MTNTNQNIPTLSVTAVVELLSKLYCNAIEKNIPFRKLSTPFLWGAAGVGKSEGIRQLAQQLEKQTGKRVVVTDVRLYLYSPVDVRGVLVADEQREFTKWLRPKVFDLDPSEDVINILFLDELSAAPQSVQVVAYQISLDRAVGEHPLPENCIIMAAGNRTTDQSVSYKMPKALCNRMKHFCISPDYVSWRAWAVSHGIDNRVISYLAFDHSRLFTEPGTADLAYPTPRSWSFVSEDLQTMDCPPKKIHDLISANVGTDTALEFEKWCQIYDQLPPVSEILNGRCTVRPTRHDVLFALVASLTTALRDRGDSVTVTELENACAYAQRFPEDFRASFFMDLNAIDCLKLKLMKCPSMRAKSSRKTH